jgi:hypothetical protein
MPRIELTDSELTVRMSHWERMMAFTADFRVPLSHVRGATEDSGFGGPGGMRFGLRSPGTHIPFIVAAGTFVQDGDRQFVFTRCGRQTVVIELANSEWTRLVIGVKDARAEASRINAAVARLSSRT